MYFEGNSIRKVIYESKFLRQDGSFVASEYIERDMNVETDDRYLLLPKTSRGKKKPWTASLLMNTLSYFNVSLEVDLTRRYIRAYNYRTNEKLQLPPFTLTGKENLSSSIEFYTYVDEYIRGIPADHESALRSFRGE